MKTFFDFSGHKMEPVRFFFNIEPSPLLVAIHDIQNRLHDRQHIVHLNDMVHHS